MNTGPNSGEDDPLGRWPLAVDPIRIYLSPSIRRALSTFSIHHREGTNNLNLWIRIESQTALKLNRVKDIELGEK